MSERVLRGTTRPRCHRGAGHGKPHGDVDGGPYEIQAPLGAGGMAEVYKARDTRLDRTVETLD